MSDGVGTASPTGRVSSPDSVRPTGYTTPIDRVLYALFARHADDHRHVRDRKRYRGTDLRLSFDVYLARVYGLSWVVAVAVALVAALVAATLGARPPLPAVGDVLPLAGVGLPTPSTTVVVAAAGVAPFEATLTGLGVFPSLDYVRVVWLGVGAGSAELTRLADAVERETVAAGFDPRDHDEFTPHVTLARMSDARGKARVQELVDGDDEETSPEPGSFRVEAVRLMESTGGDPRYRTVERVPLES